MTPLLFIGFSAWMVAHALSERPLEALFGGLTIASGLVAYAIVRHLSHRSRFLGTTGGSAS